MVSGYFIYMYDDVHHSKSCFRKACNIISVDMNMITDDVSIAQCNVLPSIIVRSSLRKSQIVVLTSPFISWIVNSIRQINPYCSRDFLMIDCDCKYTSSNKVVS